MEAHLEWADDFLVLVCGPWRWTVADVEVYGDDTARAYLRGWVTQWAGCTPPDPGEHASGSLDREERADVLCASRAEAIEVICVLLGVRGVACPAHPSTLPAPPE